MAHTEDAEVTRQQSHAAQRIMEGFLRSWVQALISFITATFLTSPIFMGQRQCVQESDAHMRFCFGMCNKAMPICVSVYSGLQPPYSSYESSLCHDTEAKVF